MPRLARLVALAVATSLLSTGCMLSRVVDRAFLGITVRKPSYVDRKTTGVFLLPITFAIDVATFPIQALLVVILGDNFPFKEEQTVNQVLALNENPQFQKLGDEQKALAVKELQELLKSGEVTKNTALALTPEGHWQLVQLDAEARSQLIARAQAPQAEPQAVAAVCAP